MTIHRRGAAALIAAALLAPRPARAAGWPERLVTLIVPFPPGGSNDVLARLYAQQLSDMLGQRFIVDNRPGANGNIGAGTVARSAPDGYTLLLSGNGQNAMNHGLYAKMPYDSRKDFVHVAQIGSVPNALAVAAAVPAKTLRELLDRAKKEELTYAIPGTGSSGHLAMAMLLQAAGVKMQNVPYRGAAPAVTDVIAGNVPMIMANVDILKPFVDDGKLRVLAVTSPERSALYPDAPTVAESGFPNFSAIGWFGLSAPAGTPPAIVQTLHDAAVRIAQKPEIRERMATGGYVPATGSSADYAAFVSAEIDKWQRVTKEIGLTME